VEDVAILVSYLVAGFLPVAYNYVIARKLAKKYGVKVISSDGNLREFASSRDELKISKELGVLKLESVSLEGGHLHLKLSINEHVLTALLKSELKSGSSRES